IVVTVCIDSSSESWEPLAAPTSMALACRWRSRPQHHEPTYAVQQKITSSARNRSVFGNLKAKRLRSFEIDHTSSNLVDCNIDRSEGFAPLRNLRGVDPALAISIPLTPPAKVHAQIARLSLWTLRT